MVAFIRQQYNDGALSANVCQGFIEAKGVQPGTCQCVLAQLCVRFLSIAFPGVLDGSPPPGGRPQALAYLLMSVLRSDEDSPPSTVIPRSNEVMAQGSPELLNNVFLLANVLQSPISWSTLQTCGFTTQDVCTILVYSSPGLIQSTMDDFTLCGTSGVPFGLSTITSIPDRFISSSSRNTCGVACGEWLSEFQKDADDCKDFVQSLFNFTSSEDVAQTVCQNNGIFFGQSSSDQRSPCIAAVKTSLDTMTTTATNCCTSSKAASRQKGLRWFLLGLGVVCAVLLVVGAAGLFAKLGVMSKKQAINTVYNAKANAVK
jgi:hypothetical protein